MPSNNIAMSCLLFSFLQYGSSSVCLVYQVVVLLRDKCLPWKAQKLLIGVLHKHILGYSTFSAIDWPFQAINPRLTRRTSALRGFLFTAYHPSGRTPNAQKWLLGFNGQHSQIHSKLLPWRCTCYPLKKRLQYAASASANASRQLYSSCEM